jgi:hypothetical protein
MLEIDSIALVVVTAGILLAVAGAILVGTLTARLLFRASREVDELIDSTR